MIDIKQKPRDEKTEAMIAMIETLRSELAMVSARVRSLESELETERRLRLAIRAHR